MGIPSLRFSANSIISSSESLDKGTFSDALLEL